MVMLKELLHMNNYCLNFTKMMSLWFQRTALLVLTLFKSRDLTGHYLEHRNACWRFSCIEA